MYSSRLGPVNPTTLFSFFSASDRSINMSLLAIFLQEARISFSFSLRSPQKTTTAEDTLHKRLRHFSCELASPRRLEITTGTGKISLVVSPVGRYHPTSTRPLESLRGSCPPSNPLWRNVSLGDLSPLITLFSTWDLETPL
ncbi:hypothetical protein FQN60_005156 [Etheostoma spectabile]|uniref:Uncharacterized protein n=1 Tax=Etheostoma spectabile TaxID=54343 RepID=A0A5J5DLZ4_9PERO|nr:hypothetical protein FQN60_005156 [Etheostoma spectabile]